VLTFGRIKNYGGNFFFVAYILPVFGDSGIEMFAHKDPRKRIEKRPSEEPVRPRHTRTNAQKNARRAKDF
jgi:hypothetical protein